MRRAAARLRLARVRALPNNNSVALGAGTTTTADNQVNVGGRTVSGVTNGSLAAGSSDAVTGDQINTIMVNQAATDATQNANILANTAAISTLQSNDTTENAQIASLQATDTAQNASDRD